MELRPGYKQTEVGLIPEDWEVRPFGDCLSVRPDYGINAPAVPYSDRLPVYIRITDITEEGRFSPEKLASVNSSSSGNYFLGEGDLVFARTGASVGKSYLYDKKDGQLVFAGFLIRVRPNPRKLVPAFAAAYVQTGFYWNWVRLMSMRSGQPGINGNEFAQLLIPVPPLPEQRAIVQALGDVDALLASLTQLIAKKRDLKQAAMQQLLTGETRLPGFSGEWEVKRLGDIFTFFNTANNSRADLSELGDVGYIHYGDIHTHHGAFLDCTATAIPLINKSKVSTVPFVHDGDLVMVDASEDYEGIGKCVEVRNVTDMRVVAGLHTFLLRGSREQLADGFKGYLQFIPSVKSAMVKLATGISVYGISKNNVRSIEVRLPNVDEQSAIAAVLSDMDAEIAALEARLEKTRALKQGMMQELLNGKTRLI